MAFAAIAAGTAIVFAGASGTVVPAAPAEEAASSSFTNSAKSAVGRMPSGVTVTVRKKMIGRARVASAAALPADLSAPADDYLVPANAKMMPGFIDLYENFAVKPGAWTDVARLTFTFSRPVRDPHLHLYGTGGASGRSANRRDDYWPAVDLIKGVPAKPAFSRAAGFPGYRVTPGSVEPERVYRAKSTSCGVVYTCGTIKVNGTVSAFTVKLRAHDVRYGSGGSTPQLWAALKLSLTEDDSDAPASYGAASHTIGDSHLGSSVSADHTDAVSMTPRALPIGTDADDAVATSSSWVASGGRGYALAVPVTAGSPSTVAGWIDFDHNGRFDVGERAVAEVATGATTALLHWTVPWTWYAAPTWIRLRLAAGSEALDSPVGWAGSGEVEDHRIQLAPDPAFAGVTDASPHDVLFCTNPTCFMIDRALRGSGHAFWW